MEHLKDYMQTALLKLADLVVYIDSGANFLFTDEEKFVSFFGVRPSKTWASDGLLIPKLRIHQDDIEVEGIIHSKEALLSVNQDVSVYEYRTLSSDEKYFWVRSTVIPIGESESNLNTLIAPYKYVVCFKNISKEKGKITELIDAVKRDAYTDLFNKKHTQESVEKALSKNKRGALFLMDIDDFKSVNDRMGHLLGDVVILKVANKLKKLFGPSCVLGRVGGDEFLGYFPECTKQNAEITAKLILNMVEQVKYGHAEKYNITCSVGVAMYPKDACDYKGLYEKADLAGYESKSSGKNSFSFYSQNMCWDNISYGHKRELSTTSETSLNDSNLLEYTFRILNEASYSRSVLNQVLVLVAQHFGATRAYYIKYKNSKAKIEFEWTSDGDSKQVHDLLPRFETEGYLKNYQGNGIYYRSDAMTTHPDSAILLKRSGIKSFLHCAILGDDEIEGFIAFEGQSVLSDDEFMLLSLVSKIITENIKHTESEEKHKSENERLKSMLNALGKMVYTIDIKSYNLTYANEVMKNAFPLAEEAQKCYKILRNGKSPCTDCPLKTMKGGKTTQFSYSITSSKPLKTNFRRVDMAGKRDNEVLCWAELVTDKNELELN